jgi:hypothetical protein
MLRRGGLLATGRRPDIRLFRLFATSKFLQPWPLHDNVVVEKLLKSVETPRPLRVIQAIQNLSNVVHRYRCLRDHFLNHREQQVP